MFGFRDPERLTQRDWKQFFESFVCYPLLSDSSMSDVDWGRMLDLHSRADQHRIASQKNHRDSGDLVQFDSPATTLRHIVSPE